MLTGKERLTETQAAQISPVTLAFAGDAVFSLFIREKLVLETGGKAADLQKTAAKVVSAKGQSALLEVLLPHLTETETDVFRRGKNAKKATKSKSASHLEYSRSTGFEALLGYLYFTGATERIREILEICFTEAFRLEETAKPFKPIRR